MSQWPGMYGDMTLQWRHNERDGVSNHLIRRRSKKTWTFPVTGLCGGNPPVTGGFPSQRASYSENTSIWWRHHYRNAVDSSHCGPVISSFEISWLSASTKLLNKLSNCQSTMRSLWLNLIETTLHADISTACWMVLLSSESLTFTGQFLPWAMSSNATFEAFTAKYFCDYDPVICRRKCKSKQVNGVEFWKRNQRPLYACAQPMSDVVTVLHHLSLAGRIHMITGNISGSILTGMFEIM